MTVGSCYGDGMYGYYHAQIFVGKQFWIAYIDKQINAKIRNSQFADRTVVRSDKESTERFDCAF